MEQLTERGVSGSRDGACSQVLYRSVRKVGLGRRMEEEKKAPPNSARDILSIKDLTLDKPN